MKKISTVFYNIQTRPPEPTAVILLDHKAKLRTPSKKSSYNPTVDYVRIIAAFVIVLFHAHAPGWQFGEAAVGYFIVVMTIFTWRAASRIATLGAYTRSRATRILRPWAYWSVIYAALITAKAIVAGNSPIQEIMQWLPPQGTQAQLWFLPFAFLISILIALFALALPQARREAPSPALIAAFALAGLCAAPFLLRDIWMAEELSLVVRLPFLYTGSVAFGLVIAFIGLNRPVLLTIAAITMALYGLWLHGVGLRGAQQFIIGAPLAAFALMVRLPDIGGFARVMGALSMDIYLNHIILIALLRRLDIAEPGSATFGILACLLSTAAALALRRTRLKTYLS